MKRRTIGPNDDGRRRLFEMKQRMNIATTRPYFLYVADLENLANFQVQVTDLSKCVDDLTTLELVPAMNARTCKDLKGTAKSVLVNSCRCLKPKIYIDMKSWSRIDGDRRIGEITVQIPLRRELFLLKGPIHDIPHRKFGWQISFFQRPDRDRWQKLLIVILL